MPATAEDGNTGSSLSGDADYGDYGMLSDGSCTSSGSCEPPAETPFPAYYGLQMLTHLGQVKDTMVSTSSENHLVAVHAVKQANGQLAVMLINTDPNTTYDVTVSLSGFSARGTATVYHYGEKSTGITTSSQPVSGSKLTVSVAPYSTNIVVLP